jgi:hypothetical protein
MEIVVSCDYLISPAFCNADLFAGKVEDLISIKREMDNKSGKVLIEKDSLSKLVALNYYPCAPLFNQNIPRELREEFSANDIARVINNIATNAMNENYFMSDCVAEWTSKAFLPVIVGSNHMRQVALSHLLEEVFLANYLCNRSLSILHHPLAPNIDTVNISGDISDCIPVKSALPICALNEQISIFSEYQSFLSQFDAKEMYSRAVTHEQVQEAISIGAASVVRRTGAGSLREFDIGDEFLASLDAHQCAPGQRYSRTAFEVICHVIANVSKYPHNPMYSDLDKGIQESKGDALGWRTQITKGNPALRLMYWVDDKKLTLANVGNKKALEIL